MHISLLRQECVNVVKRRIEENGYCPVLEDGLVYGRIEARIVARLIDVVVAGRHFKTGCGRLENLVRALRLDVVE